MTGLALKRLSSKASLDYAIRYNVILSYFKKTSGNMLDVGCGLGTLGKMLEIGGMNVVYLDIKPQLLKHMKGKDRVAADGSKLPFRDRSFDFTVSADTLEHLPQFERRTFIVELLRCARRKVVFTVCQLHSENPKRPGVLLFSFLLKLFKLPYPEWYREHNAQEIPRLSYIKYTIHCCGFHPYTKSYQGMLGIFFPLLKGFGRVLMSRHRRVGPVFQKFVEYFLLFISNVIDIPPYYSFAFIVKLE